MPQTQDSAAPAERHVRRVLLAEHSPTVALFARTLLERKGFTVRLVGGEGEALPALTEDSYDLAVVDAAVPGAGAIAATCAAQAIPVLAILADGGTLEGASAEVAAPINATAFHAAVRHSLDRSKAALMQAGGLDAGAILALWGATDSQSFLGVAGVFVTELEERLALMPALLAGDDRAGLELHAHSIKGAASNVGATALHAAALALEAQSRTAGPDELATLAAGLHTAAVPAIACLQSLIRARQD